MRIRWVTAGVGALALSIAVGGSGVGASSPMSVPPGSAVPGGPVGDAAPIAPGVEVRPGASGSYASVAASTPVSVGDGVRTDATGFAEVAYSDGSRTRLDVNTELEVVGLTDDAGNSVTGTQMGLGRTWNRAQSTGSTGGSVVATSQGTATGAGAAFLVSCLTSDSCDFSVMAGTVDVELADGTVIPVVAPATLDVTAGVASNPLPLPWDGLFGDPWLVANTDRDVDAGFADRATVYQAYGPAYASMVGTYDVTTAVSDLSCVDWCGHTAPLGTDLSFTGEYSTQCEGGGACAVVGQAGIPYAFDGVTYTINSPAPNNFCWMDDDGDGSYDEGEAILSPEWTTASDVFLAPSAAEVGDGDYLVTDFVWHRVTVANPEGIPCEEPAGTFKGVTLTDDGTGTRTG